MCPPTHFDVTYAINPWMDPTVPVDSTLAWRQWQSVVDMLRDAGDELVFVDPQPGCPDMVFLGDAGVVLGDRFLCSRFRHPERAAEADHYRRWFRDFGLDVQEVPDEAVFEGLGDLANWGTQAIVGRGPRTNQAGVSALREFAPQLNILAEVELPDPRFYHLATAVTFIGEDTVLYNPRALTLEGAATIERVVARAVAVGEQDALRHQACNCLTVGSTVIMDGCTERLRAQLGELGLEVVVAPASEFKKGGGSVRCLALTTLDYDRARDDGPERFPHARQGVATA